MTPRDLSTLIVEKYLASYTSHEEDGITYSACDLDKSEPLVSAVTVLAGALKSSIDDSAARQRIMAVRSKVQCFYVQDNIDLVDFCTLLAKAGSSPGIAAACQQVIHAVADSYVIKQGYKGAEMKNSHGLAIYFPTRAVSPLYAGLDFSKKTGWDQFLKAYLTAIRYR